MEPRYRGKLVDTLHVPATTTLDPPLSVSTTVVLAVHPAVVWEEGGGGVLTLRGLEGGDDK